MNSAAVSSLTPNTDDSLAELVAEITDKLHAGQPVDLEDCIRRCPERAEELRRLLPALEALAALEVSTPAQESPSADQADTVIGTLGDFRVIREVGRGGMGIVYEAEQISLGRRVALKVLPFAGTLDARRLQRFKNEAQAAAHLQHQHIVPVYFVGQERGVHYYAMQFVEGRTLASLIVEARPTRDGGVIDQPPAKLEGSEVTTDYNPADGAVATIDAHGPHVQTRVNTTSATSAASRIAYFRTVAGWGEQAAEALEHAHQMGVIHRDIKPANLMVDNRSHLWITDSGLAQFQKDANLTLTGDLVGTLRYMSPEQALAKRSAVDHRTDVYSLGVTLYELLTLEPAFTGRGRQEVLQQIAFEEPTAPRRRNKAIPAELETIVLKAVAKVPDERYATAQELADDLRHWLEDRPIRARRPSFVLRLRRWSRRHRPLVAGVTAALLMGLMVLGGCLGWIAHDRATRQARVATAIGRALEEAADWQQQARIQEALLAARRADALLAEAHVDPALAQQVNQRLRDLKLIDHLEQIRLDEDTIFTDDVLDLESADTSYERTFRAAGLDALALPADAVAGRIRASTLAAELAAVLDQWSWERRRHHGKADPGWRELLRVACLADPEPWRTKVRHALMAADGPALRRLAASAKLAHLPPLTVEVLASALEDDTQAATARESLLCNSQREHPGDFWINMQLAIHYLEAGRRPAEAIRFASVAVSIRPHSPAAHDWLAICLFRARRYEEAVAECQKAIRLKPDYFEAHYNLAEALGHARRLDEAAAEFREAFRLKPDCASAHARLGRHLFDQGHFHRAALEFRRALALASHDPLASLKASNGLRDAEAKARFDDHLTDVLAGRAQPKNLSEKLNLAWHAQQRYKALYAASARFYRDIFAAQPKLADDMSAQNRYNAACAAALAGCGQGKDSGKLSTADRIHWRQQALAWLRADLNAYQRLIHQSGGKTLIAQRLQQWLDDTDLAGVRNPGTLAQLPEKEQAEWQKLWQEVKELCQRAARQPPAANHTRPPNTGGSASSKVGRQRPWLCLLMAP